MRPPFFVSRGIMASYDVEYFAKLNDEQVLAALLRIDRNISKLGADADKEFQKVGKSAGASGVQIGAIAGVVSSLTTEFINLGKRAVSALADATKESVRLAAGLEVSEKVFTGIFKGNKDVALAALGAIRIESRKLGADLTETASNFLPFVSSLEQLKRIGKISSALGISQPEQVASGGVRIALQEALSGNALSLVRRFEIPKEFAKKLQGALDEGGVEGFLTEFEAVLKTLGRDLDSLGGGFQQASGKATIAGQQIGEAFGGPILDELTEQLNTLNDTVAGNFDDFELIADVFGRVLANVVDIVGSGLNDFLAGLDTEQIVRIGETLFGIVENVKSFAQVLGVTDVPQNLIDGIESIATKLESATETAIKLSAIIKAELAKSAAELAKSQELNAGTAGAFRINMTPENEAAIATAGQDAYNKVISDSLAILDESAKRKEENRQATDDLAASQKESEESALNEADAFLADADATRELEQAKEDAANAQKKVDEAFAEAEKDFQRKLEDIDIETARKRLDIATEFAQKRVDQARKNLQALADLETKYQNDVDGAATDLARTEEDIARKHGREQVDLEREQRQSLLDIELDYQRRLQDITRQSSLDLDEAAQARDAVSFVKILKKRNEEITQAGSDRNKEIADLQISGEQKRAELQLQQEQEIQDARIANERKLADLRTNLDQQIEAQNLANQRAFDDLALAEERKNEELTLSQERQIEDANRAYERKKEDLLASLADELAIIAAGNAATEAEQARHIDAMNSINASLQSPGAGAGFGANPGTIATSTGSTRSGTAVPGTRGGAPTSGSSTPSRLGGRGGANVGAGLRHLALGGDFLAGEPVVVGDGGKPEVIVSDRPGTVIGGDELSSFVGSVHHGSAGSGSGAPVTAAQQAAGMVAKRNAPTLPSAPGITSNFTAPGGGMNISNNKDITVNLPMADPSTFIGNPIVRASIQNLVIQTVDKIVS